MLSVCPTRERRLSVRPTRTAFRLACPALSATRGPSAGGPAAPLSACSGLPWPRLALHAECRGGNRPWSLTSPQRALTRSHCSRDLASGLERSRKTQRRGEGLGASRAVGLARQLWFLPQKPRFLAAA